MLDDAMRFRCPDNVAASVLDGEAVMIHLESGRYYSADGPAAVVWQLLESGARVSEITTKVAVHFELPPERAREDGAALVDGVPAYRLDLGHDRREIAPRIREILDEAGG